MDFELSTTKNFEDLPERNYINECCIGGDEILNQIKADIASKMTVMADSIETNQEDWGWTLKFVKDEIDYFLGISNYNLLGTNKTTFGFSSQATKKAKGFFVSKNVEAETEADKFHKIVLDATEKKGFEVK